MKHLSTWKININWGHVEKINFDVTNHSGTPCISDNLTKEEGKNSKISWETPLSKI